MNEREFDNETFYKKLFDKFKKKMVKSGVNKDKVMNLHNHN